MTYEALKEKAQLIDEVDVCDNGIYLYTIEYWICIDGLFAHEVHPNKNRYTGKTTTYHVADLKDLKSFSEEYCTIHLGMTEDGYNKAMTYIKDNYNWGGYREGAGRPSTGRKSKYFWVTDEEYAMLKEYLNKLRQ